MYRIVLIEFYFSDKKQSKLRPALTLSDTDKLGDVIVASITSNIRRSLDMGDLFITSDNTLFSQTGLKVSSVVRLSKLATIHTSRIKGELGLLPKQYRNKVHEGIREVFGIK